MKYRLRIIRKNGVNTYTPQCSLDGESNWSNIIDNDTLVKIIAVKIIEEHKQNNPQTETIYYEYID